MRSGESVALRLLFALRVASSALFACLRRRIDEHWRRRFRDKSASTGACTRPVLVLDDRQAARSQARERGLGEGRTRNEERSALAATRRKVAQARFGSATDLLHLHPSTHRHGSSTLVVSVEGVGEVRGPGRWRSDRAWLERCA